MWEKSADLVNRVLLTGKKSSYFTVPKYITALKMAFVIHFVYVCEVKENSFSVSVVQYTVVQYTEPHTSGQGFFFFSPSLFLFDYGLQEK